MTSAAADPARITAEQRSPAESRAPSISADAARLRDTIARRLADLLFLPSGQLAPAEKALIDSLLVPLYGSLEGLERERLARRIAELREMPPQLARRMARDEPAIARLVLERADVLDEQDLLTLVKMGSHAHRLAVAMRPELPSSVAEELVAHGRADVIEAVLRNATAKLSRRAFHYLVELSRRDGRLPPHILAREDLPVDIAHDLFWYVESPLRWEIIMRFALERRLMAGALSDLPPEAQASADPPVRAVMSVLGVTKPAPAPQEALAETLGHWLRAEGHAGVPVLRWSGVSKATLERVRRDPWGEPQVVLFKALGAPKAALTLIERVLAPRWAERERGLRVAHLSRLFDSIARDWAELLLRLWDRKPLGALDEFIEDSRVNGSSRGPLSSLTREESPSQSETKP